MGWASIVVCLIVFGVPYLLVIWWEAQPGKPLALTRYYWINVTLGLLVLPVVALLGYVLVGVAAGFVMLAPMALIDLGLGWVVLVGIGVYALWVAYSWGKDVGQRHARHELEMDPEAALRVYLAALAEPRREHLDVADAKQELQAQRLYNDYVEVMHHWNGRISSEELLPASNQAIKSAIVAVARAEKAAGEVPPEVMEQFRMAYGFLADFVPREEAEVMRAYDDLRHALHGHAIAKDLSPVELAKVITESRTWDLGSEIQQRTTDEFARLIDEFNAAVES